MHKLGSTLQKLGLGLVAAALLSVFLLAILQVSRPGLESAAAGQAAVSQQGLTPIPPFDLPVFDPAAGSSVTGITRRTRIDTIIPERPRMDVATYTVKTGDNLFRIAEQFGLKPETVLWGNYETLRDNPQFLRPGQVLSILPVDGVYYQMPEGENLEQVADFFEVEPEAIVNFPGNGLILDLTEPRPAEIAAGSWLIIPGGRRELKDWGPPVISRKNPAAAAYYGSGSCGKIYNGAIGTGAFIWPTVAKTLSGYDYSPSLHPGLDIAGATGNAVYAVDGGVVVYSGWSEYGFGYLIVVDHGTGWQSAYAHLNSVNVGCGESVLQGQLIGGVGNTGNSTGPHLHFELRSEIYGKVNPWDFLA